MNTYRYIETETEVTKDLKFISRLITPLEKRILSNTNFIKNRDDRSCRGWVHRTWFHM